MDTINNIIAQKTCSHIQVDLEKKYQELLADCDIKITEIKNFLQNTNKSKQEICECLDQVSNKIKEMHFNVLELQSCLQKDILYNTSEDSKNLINPTTEDYGKMNSLDKVGINQKKYPEEYIIYDGEYDGE